MPAIIYTLNKNKRRVLRSSAMDQRLAKNNYDYCKDTLLLKHDIERNYVELAGRLCTIEDGKMYEPNYESFNEFLEDVNITPSVASRMKTIWRRFVVEYKIKLTKIAEAGGWDKVYSVIKVTTNKGEAEEWLERLSGDNKLRRSDLRKELKERETGIEMSKCRHRHTETITFHKCLDCHDTWRDYVDK